MIDMNRVKRMYLKAIGAGGTLKSKVSFEYSNGFLLTSLMCFVLPTVLVIAAILNIMEYGLVFMSSPQFILTVFGALAAYALSVQRTNERIELITKTFQRVCETIRLTASGAIMKLRNGGTAEIRFESQSVNAYIISVSMPNLSTPLSFKLSRNQIEALLSKSRNSLKLLNAMLESDIKSLEFRGSPNTKLKFPRKVMSKPGMWISAKFSSVAVENAFSCIMEFIDSVSERVFVATLAQAIIEIGFTEYDISDMYYELLSYHEVFFGSSAKTVLDKLIEKTSITNRIPRDLAIVMAWKKMPRSFTVRQRSRSQ